MGCHDLMELTNGCEFIHVIGVLCATRVGAFQRSPRHLLVGLVLCNRMQQLLREALAVQSKFAHQELRIYIT